MYTTRYLEKILLETHKTFKVVYLGGPRQVGKTTVLRHLAEGLNINYVSLDNLAARRLANDDPDLFLQKYQQPLFIDEVQYAPGIFQSIKSIVDQEDKNGQYWLTGSQQFHLMKNVKESLAGRVGILSLLGFSLAEEKNIPGTTDAFLPGIFGKTCPKTKAPHIFQHILRGSFPALARKNAPALETFYNSYLQTYLDRDLRDIFHVMKLSSFHTFLQLCAARTGQVLNCSDLARDAAISVHAAKEWLSILEAGMQIYLLKPYFGNISKRLIKSPKLYFLDTGLAAFLTKWKTADALMNGAMAGAFFETFAVGEIIKSYLHRGEDPPLYYFRDKEGHEVDVIIERNNKIYPVEIKMSANITKSDIKNISYLREKSPNVDRGGVISLSLQNLPIDGQNEIIPIGAIS